MTVSQSGYISKVISKFVNEQLLEKFKTAAVCRNPSKSTLPVTAVRNRAKFPNTLPNSDLEKFKTSKSKFSKTSSVPKDNHKLSDTDKELFVSIVMSLLYVARFTRPDILFSVTVLTQKNIDPYSEDLTAAYRVLRYLHSTSNHGLVFDCSDIILLSYADASHAFHADGKGHGGTLLTLGSAPIYSRSWKLKHQTTSSTDSEISAMSELVSVVIWTRALLDELGFPQLLPTPAFQDNTSAITMNEAGGGSFKRSKHLIVRNAFITEFITDKTIKLVYLKTADMIPDIFTKAMYNDMFEYLRDLLCVKPLSVA